MPTYAVKIGEVLLKSDKPITPEQLAQAIRDLSRRKSTALIETIDGVDVAIVVMKV